MNDYEIFISYSGELVIKNNKSLHIYIISVNDTMNAFSNDDLLHQMILFPIERIPKGKKWKRHREWIEKIFLMS